MTIKANPNKNKFIAISVVCSVGVLFFSIQQFFNKGTEDVLSSILPQKDIAMEKAVSTSKLIDEAANNNFPVSEGSDLSYPNITPLKLEDPFSPTLEGTDVDGQIRVGEDGKVVLDLAVKDFFDYFLGTVGEVTPELALNELLKVIGESLPPENAKEAKELLESYLAYKQDVMNLMAQPTLPKGQQTREYQLQVLEDSLAQLRDLRRAHMPEEQVDAFFGLEEDYEKYTLATIRIQFDETMSESDKAQLIEYQRSLLPDPIRKTEVQVAHDNEKNTKIHKSLTSDDEATLASKLEEHGYTEQQKEQVLSYKRQQAEFDKRYQEYASEKAERFADVSSPEEKERILMSLQSEYFLTETEKTQARVRDLRG